MTTRERVSIHSTIDLEAQWRRLMEPLGFARRTLWALFIEHDGEVLPEILQIDDMPAAPSTTDADNVVSLVGGLAAHTGGLLRLAFLFSRPGSSAPDDRDRAWARVLYDAMSAAGMRQEVVHVATDAVLVPVPLDDAGLRPDRQLPGD